FEWLIFSKNWVWDTFFRKIILKIFCNLNFVYVCSNRTRMHTIRTAFGSFYLCADGKQASLFDDWQLKIHSAFNHTFEIFFKRFKNDREVELFCKGTFVAIIKY